MCGVVILTFFPEWDIGVSQFFFDRIGRFLPKHDGAAGFIYDATRFTLVPTFIMVLVGLLIRDVKYHHNLPFFGRKELLFLLFTLLLGPGIIVHYGFKDHWGRARPVQVQEFGGMKTFSPALLPSNQCEENCSLPSGHAAIGFYFLSLAFVLKGRRKILSNSIGVVAGLGIGLVRILQGGHFLSDVLFSGVVVYVTAYLLHWIIFRKTNAMSV
jgi:lipid A 4'-phosphatase